MIIMKEQGDPMRRETFDFTGYQGMRIPAVMWLPEGYFRRFVLAIAVRDEAHRRKECLRKLE